MDPTIQIFVLLLHVVAAIAVLALRLNSTFYTLHFDRVFLPLIPGLPRIEIAPEFVLLVVLPPLLYSSAVSMSWREFDSICAQ